MTARKERKKQMLDKAIADFAVAYADQTERDHQMLVEAVRPVASWPRRGYE